jgi:hypothetical protein
LIVAITGPGTAALSIRNISSLPADQVPEIKSALTTKLRVAGLQLASTTVAATEVQVTLSENAQGYVWVAQVKLGSEIKVAMVTAPRAHSVAPAPATPSMSVRKTPLFSQGLPILDAATFPSGNDRNLLVLDPENVTLYNMVGGRWQVSQKMPLLRVHAWPRDLRGKLVLARDHLFDAYLPGVLCSSSGGAPLVMNCREGDDPWPVGTSQRAFYSPARNFFTGVLVPAVGQQGSVAPFYSAAPLARPNYTMWVLSRVDGTVHVLDGMNDIAMRGARDWGNGLAAVQSSCGSGAQLLVTAAGDGSAADVLRAFEIVGREPVEASAPVDFSGPVTALWTAPDGRTAIAVAHNLNTGAYDAFELAVTCGQ